jgi:hypothetical protein
VNARTQGGFWGGSSAAVSWFANDYYQLFERFLRNGDFVAIDQTVGGNMNGTVIWEQIEAYGARLRLMGPWKFGRIVQTLTDIGGPWGAVGR